MKRIGLTLMAVFLMTCSLFSQINIPDAAFLNALIEKGVDTNGDGQISIEEAEAMISLYVSEKGITDMTGIEAFVNLTELSCSQNDIASLNLSNAIDLIYLSCYSNQLTSLDVSANTALTDLVCSKNLLTILDVFCKHCFNTFELRL